MFLICARIIESSLFRELFAIYRTSEYVVATIEILTVDCSAILKNAKNIDHRNIVDSIQVVDDLFCLDSAGRDAASKLYEMIRNEQQKTEKNLLAARVSGA